MRSVGVIGAGTMGSGIALASALSGYDVVLYDIALAAVERAQKGIKVQIDKSIEKGKLTAESGSIAAARIKNSSTLEDLKDCDLIVEAAIERLDIKKELFGKLSEICSTECILSSNTSSLSITAIASACKHPERVLGLHFFNPAHIMKLVEIIRGQQTSDAVVAAADAYVKKLGKVPVLAKDTPGFVVNRVARNFYGESFRVLNEGIASHEQIDRVMRSNGFAMGPFQLMDLIGIDVNLSVTQSVYDQFFGEPRFRPHLIQQKMVEANHLGRKTGRGFYDYTEKA